MNPLSWPWLDFAIAFPLIAAIFAAFTPDRLRALRIATVGCGASFAAAWLAWLGHHFDVPALDHPFLRLDELNAPLVPSLALLHFLMALTTSKWKAESFGASRYSISLALRIAMFACFEPWLLVVLSIACAVPSFFDLRTAKKSTRVYLLHMGSFAAFLAIGWALVDAGNAEAGAVFLVLASLVRSGVFPAHVWIVDLIEHGSFSSAVLMVTPMLGVYIAVRLALPIAPAWLLSSVTWLSLLTAVYSSGMAVVQTETRRFFAHLFISFASLVFVGLEIKTEISVSASLSLWFSVLISAGGLTVVLRAVEARHGRLSLGDFHGLSERSPLLALGFLVTGLACVGFPGTLGFVSAELLIDGTLHSNIWIGLVVIVVSGLNGIAVMRAYWSLFTGAKHVGASPLLATGSERLAIILLTGIIFGGGLFPQPGLTSRHEASEVILQKTRSL